MGRLQKKKPASKKKKTNGPANALVAQKKPQSAVSVTKQSDQKASALKAPRFWTSTVQFLREVKIELKKVTWPSRKQTMGSTVVVIILTIIISIFLGTVDLGLTNVVKLVLQ